MSSEIYSTGSVAKVASPELAAVSGNVFSQPGRWLFSAPVDLSVFLGSAVVSLLALWIGARAGVLNGDSPDWVWVPAVLLIDVAHVWATGFRVYFDTDEQFAPA